MDNGLHSDGEEGGGIRKIGNSLAAVSPDNQCMREEYEGQAGCARKKIYESGVGKDEYKQYY